MENDSRIERLVDLHRELAQLLTREERRTYNDPVEGLGDLIDDLQLVVAAD